MAKNKEEMKVNLVKLSSLVRKRRETFRGV